MAADLGTEVKNRLRELNEDKGGDGILAMQVQNMAKIRLIETLCLYFPCSALRRVFLPRLGWTLLKGAYGFLTDVSIPCYYYYSRMKADSEKHVRM